MTALAPAPHDLRALCTRLEQAQCSQSVAFARAAGGVVRRSPGGVAVYFGEGHMLDQALALGLEAPLPESELVGFETLLATGGHPVVVELSAGADPELPALLARRGYAVRQMQQVWLHALEHSPQDDVAPARGVEIRLIAAAEAETLTRVVMAGFLDTDELAQVEPAMMMPLTRAAGTHCLLAFVDGHPAAGGSVGIHEGTAALSGTSVLPRFRGRGLQRALTTARLALAREHGCTAACSVTLPWTASAENLQRAGFRAAYPKIEMVKASPRPE